MLSSPDLVIVVISVSHSNAKAMRANVVRLKQQDPNCRWRVEQTVGTFQEIVQAMQIQEQGLEQPESHWVELSEYIKEFPAPEEGEICYENINGQRVAGVNVLTGKKGWHKRIDRNSNAVSRITDLSDKACDLDPTGAALDRITKAAQKQIMQKHVTIRSANLHRGQLPAASGSSSSKGAAVNEPAMEDNATDKPDEDIADDDDESEDEGVFSMMSCLKSRFTDAHPVKVKGEAKSKAKAKAKAQGKSGAKGNRNNKITIGNQSKKRKATTDPDQVVSLQNLCLGLVFMIFIQFIYSLVGMFNS